MGKQVQDRPLKKSASSSNPDRVATGPHQRSKSTIKRLQMYKSGGKVVRNRQGRVLRPAPFQTGVKSGEVARVEPNRKWFGNTKVITQSALQTFQEEMGKVIKDPYKVIMRKTGLPISLLQERSKHTRVHLLDTESFKATFGQHSLRKRPKLFSADLQELAETAEKNSEEYKEDEDKNIVREAPEAREEMRECIYSKGQSKRLWNELYKVIDSSDVVIQVLDARDPQGTRSGHIESYLRREKPHKHMVLLLNKCDLIPTWVTTRWVTALSSEFPTLAFHSSLTNPFGKGSLIHLLRQFAKLHQDKKQIRYM
jgi:nuclear GTP-binding protein